MPNQAHTNYTLRLRHSEPRMPLEPPAGFTLRRRGVGVSHRPGKRQPAPVPRYGASGRHPSLAAGGTSVGSRPDAHAQDDALMISDLDICRAALVMVKGYGDGAAIEAAMRADEFLDQGNLDGSGCGCGS